MTRPPTEAEQLADVHAALTAGGQELADELLGRVPPIIAVGIAMCAATRCLDAMPAGERQQVERWLALWRTRLH